MQLSAVIQHNPVASFIIATLLLSFVTCFLPVPKESAFTIIAFLLVLIPTVVAFTLTAVTEGRQGVRAFLTEIFRKRTAFKWVLVAIGFSIVLRFGSSILALASGSISTIEITPPTAFFFAFFPLAMLEEIGWRGFALRRLLDRHSPFTATLIMGIPWAMIHYVLFVVTMPEVSPTVEMLAAFALALPLTWLYVRSGHSVIVATLMHGTLNALGIIGANTPPADGISLLLISTCIVAGILVLIDWRMWFAKPVGPKVEPAVCATASLAN